MSLDPLKLPRPLSYAEQFAAAQQDAGPVPSDAAPRGGVTRKNCLYHPDTHPVVLDLLLLKRYGPEFLVFEEQTLVHYVPKDFGASSLSTANLQKIEAMRCLHLVDHPWERWEVFQAVVAGLVGTTPDRDSWHPPDVGQLLFGLDVFDNVRKDVAWGQDVQQYVLAILKLEEVHVTVPPLNFVVPPPVDGVDVDAVQRAWKGTVEKGKPTLDPDTITGRQLEKLWYAYGFFLEQRKLLGEQLHILQDHQ